MGELCVGTEGVLTKTFVIVLKVNVADFGRSSHGFRVSGGLSVFGSVFGRLSVFCMSAIGTRGVVRAKIRNVLSLASPCARCCPRRRIDDLGRVAAKGCNNVNTTVHCCRTGSHVTIIRPARNVPTTRTKIGTNSVVLSMKKGRVMHNSVGPRRFSSGIDRTLHKRPNASFILGILHPLGGSDAIVRFGVAHGGVHAGPIPCCNVIGSDVNCLTLSDFARGSTGSFGGTFVRLGRGNTGSLVVSLHSGKKNSLSRTMSVIGLCIPGKRRVIIAGKGMHRTRNSCGARGRPISARVPLTMLIGNAATSTSRVIDNSLRSLSHTMIVNSHAFKGKLIRAVHPLPCGNALGIAASGCCVPDKHYVRTVSCTGGGTSNSMTHAPSDLAAMFRATTKHRMHSKKNVHPSVRIGKSGVPGVIFCLVGSSLVFSCTARCY